MHVICIVGYPLPSADQADQTDRADLADLLPDQQPPPIFSLLSSDNPLPMDSTKRTRSDSSYQAIPGAMKKSRSETNDEAVPMPAQAYDLADVKEMTDRQVSTACIYLLELHLIQNSTSVLLMATSNGPLEPLSKWTYSRHQTHCLSYLGDLKDPKRMTK